MKTMKQPRKQNPWKKNSEGVHLLNKVTGLSPVTLLKMKSFADIVQDFAKTKLYFKLFSRTPSSGSPKRLHTTIPML